MPCSDVTEFSPEFPAKLFFEIENSFSLTAIAIVPAISLIFFHDAYSDTYSISSSRFLTLSVEYYSDLPKSSRTSKADFLSNASKMNSVFITISASV